MPQTDKNTYEYFFGNNLRRTTSCELLHAHHISLEPTHRAFPAKELEVSEMESYQKVLPGTAKTGRNNAVSSDREAGFDFEDVDEDDLVLSRRTARYVQTGGGATVLLQPGNVLMVPKGVVPWLN